MLHHSHTAFGLRRYEQRHSSIPTTPAAKPISPSVACGLLLPVDLLMIVGSAAIAYVTRFAGEASAHWMDYGLVVAFGTLLSVNVFYLSGMYEARMVRHPRAAIRGIVLGWLAVAAFLMAAGFVTKTSEDYSRIWALLWLGLGFAMLLTTRLVFYMRVAHWTHQGRLRRNVAIIGEGRFASRLTAYLADNPTEGLRIAGVFTDDTRPGARKNRSRDVSGDLRDLIDRIRRETIDTVLIALPRPEARRVREIIDRLSETPVDVRLCPGPMMLELRGCDFSHYAGIPTLNVADKPLADWRYTIKQIEDRVLGAIILTMIAPVMAAIAVAIKFDSPGPVMFRQKRYGYNNRLIEVFKFRTMYADRTDARAEQLTTRNDPRITRLGAFLRKTSLDELPQFINVIRGEMSIVGPRPHALSAKADGILYQDAVLRYAARHRIKPGITGWAQVNGWRGPTDTVTQIEKRVEHDLYYIDNWSLWLDLKIIVMTIFKGFVGRNAF